MNNDNQLEALIIQVLTERKATITTAESCSGGLIGHRLTNVPGASAAYIGGYITYSNEAKTKLLGVNPGALAEHGAVSEVVARVMAEGCCAHLGADWGVGVTGIAGPSGGTAEKPVGLVFIAVSDGTHTDVAKHIFAGDRLAIKEQTAEKALTMVWERIR